MNNFLSKNFNIHGYIMEGDKTVSLSLAENKAVGLLGIKKENLYNFPDFKKIEQEKFGIEEARDLKNQAFSSSVSGQGKVFFIFSDNFTREAQNALLKLFEEPPLKTYFFIFTTSSENIILTLKSRLVLIRAGREAITDDQKKEALDFLKKNPAKRIAGVKKIYDKKDLAKALALLDLLEVVLEDNLKKGEARLVAALEDVQKNRNLIKIKGSSLRLVLEHLALSLPTI